MKKYVLASILAIAIAAPAAANNSTSTVNQTGNVNNANVDQTGSNTGGDSLVDQSGDANYANVKQSDDGLGGAPINESTVLQSGNNNTAYVDQDSETFPVFSNWSLIDQAGDNNYADLTQRDDGQTSTILQPSDDNSAIVSQGVAGSGDTTYWNTSYIAQLDSGSHEAYVEQSGRLNDSTIIQWDYDHRASVVQGGDGNGSEVYQSGYQQEVDVSQSGDDNYSYVDQSGIFQDAFVDQSGDRNYSELFQSNFDNFADITQSGNDNLSGVYQSGVVNGAWVTQSTNANLSSVTQSGNFNSTFVAQ